MLKPVLQGVRGIHRSSADALFQSISKGGDFKSSQAAIIGRHLVYYLRFTFDELVKSRKYYLSEIFVNIKTKILAFAFKIWYVIP
jgi:hypothetical protein